MFKIKDVLFGKKEKFVPEDDLSDAWFFKS